MSSGRIGFIALLALAVAAPLSGCGGSQQKVLADAVYAKDVPVFKGATFDDISGDESWGDDPDSYTKGKTWWFKTKASKEEMLAFYTKLYPNAEKIELDTGGIELRFVPEGALNFEDVTIVVSDGELRIGESCRPQTLNKHHEKS